MHIERINMQYRIKKEIEILTIFLAFSITCELVNIMPDFDITHPVPPDVPWSISASIETIEGRVFSYISMKFFSSEEVYSYEKPDKFKLKNKNSNKKASFVLKYLNIILSLNTYEMLAC